MRDLTSEDLGEFISGNELVVLDCYTAYCPPCKKMFPILETLEKESSEVKFGSINIGEENEIALKYGVMSVPTLLIFKDGELKDRVVGLVSKDKLSKVIIEAA